MAFDQAEQNPEQNWHGNVGSCARSKRVHRVLGHQRQEEGTSTSQETISKGQTFTSKPHGLWMEKNSQLAPSAGLSLTHVTVVFFKHT